MMVDQLKMSQFKSDAYVFKNKSITLFLPSYAEDFFVAGEGPAVNIQSGIEPQTHNNTWRHFLGRRSETVMEISIMRAA
eukprot:4736718-Amphidinium_carterae.1